MSQNEYNDADRQLGVVGNRWTVGMISNISPLCSQSRKSTGPKDTVDGPEMGQPQVDAD